MAREFLDHALRAVASTVEAVTYEHHEPDPDGHTPAALLETLRARGFAVARQTYRFELTPVSQPAPGGTVTFVGLDAVDADAFVEIITRCASAGEDTGVGEVKAFIDNTARMRGGTALWRLAMIGDEPVGVILPTANDGGPVLNYIGVVPERRGQRIVDALLVETARLHATGGATRIRADSDVVNVAMHRAFERACWEQFGTRTIYRVVLR